MKSLFNSKKRWYYIDILYNKVIYELNYLTFELNEFITTFFFIIIISYSQTNEIKKFLMLITLLL